MAAFVQYLMPEVRRGQGWEIYEVLDWAAVEKGMHFRAFMKGREWRIAALFEDKWWDGTLVSRTGKKKTELARRNLNGRYSNRGIGAVRVRATHADRDDGDEER